MTRVMMTNLQNTMWK